MPPSVISTSQMANLVGTRRQKYACWASIRVIIKPQSLRESDNMAATLNISTWQTHQGIGRRRPIPLPLPTCVGGGGGGGSCNGGSSRERPPREAVRGNSPIATRGDGLLDGVARPTGCVLDGGPSGGGNALNRGPGVSLFPTVDPLDPEPASGITASTSTAASSESESSTSSPRRRAAFLSSIRSFFALRARSAFCSSNRSFSLVKSLASFSRIAASLALKRS
mmetsp:Transcript_13773/g.37295  ORF Transcript_13773/g.37295 Transcript_13773/m.37295 type:complete len:224 (+) Transcript_13773:87-758(+)